MPALYIPARVSEKRGSAVENHGGGNQQTEPPEEADKLRRQIVDQLKIQGKGQHHALERAYARDGDPDKHGPVFGLEGLFRLVCLVGAGRITQLMNGNQKVAERRLIGGPDQPGSLCGVVYRKGNNTGLLFHVVFKQPDAGRAGNPANQQLGFLCPFDRGNKGFLNQGMVKFPDTVQFCCGQLLRCDSRFCPKIIKTGQTLTVDGLANRLAALAAEVASCAIKLKGNGRLTICRFTAVKAILAGQPWADSPALTVMPLSEGSQASPLRRHSLAGPRRS